MTKTFDDYFADWEAHTFGYGYGSGEPHTVPALKQFLLLCGRALRWAQIFTLTADAQSGLLMARLVVYDEPDQLGGTVLNPVGLGCYAFIAERVRPE